MKKNLKWKVLISLMLGILPQIKGAALHYEVTPLVADRPNIAPNTDPNLINPWGLFFVPNGNFWVSDNGSNLSTAYGPSGFVENAVIKVPSFPTGAKLTSSQFVLKKGTDTEFAHFLFSTEEGKILGFNNILNPFDALVAVDNACKKSVYKGFEIIETCCEPFLVATDFHNAKIDMFDRFFNPQFSNGAFVSSIPAGYAPFNVKNINNLIYVTYAKQKAPDNHDDDAGIGHGFVDIFFPNGSLFKRLISQGHLNSPWGLALAPSNFGEFSGALLVGNFGDGKINAYHPITGKFMGQLADHTGAPIVIDGLWSLEFNDDGVLYFTSGPNDESNGLVGTIKPL